ASAIAGASARLTMAAWSYRCGPSCRGLQPGCQSVLVPLAPKPFAESQLLREDTPIRDLLENGDVVLVGAMARRDHRGNAIGLMRAELGEGPAQLRQQPQEALVVDRAEQLVDRADDTAVVDEKLRR